MNSVVNRQRQTLTRADLALVGFTAEQIDALEALRACYPYIEFFDSRQELQRLRFMKWMIGRDGAPRSSGRGRS
jgi:hypothetical protein